MASTPKGVDSTLMAAQDAVRPKSLTSCAPLAATATGNVGGQGRRRRLM